MMEPNSRGKFDKPFLPGKKLLKIPGVGSIPDRWLAGGLIGCYVLKLELTRAADGILVEGYDKITKVKINDILTLEEGKLRGEIFYVNKNRTGEAYINLITDDDESEDLGGML